MEACENCKMNRLCKELDTLGYTRGCNTLHPIHKTNADRIRSMTDEELANYAYKDLGNYCCPPGREAATKTCKNADCGSCEGCWLDWLKQEAKDG